jgi:hypothetical protein
MTCAPPAGQKMTERTRRGGSDLLTAAKYQLRMSRRSYSNMSVIRCRLIRRSAARSFIPFR